MGVILEENLTKAATLRQMTTLPKSLELQAIPPNSHDGEDLELKTEKSTTNSINHLSLTYTYKISNNLIYKILSPKIETASIIIQIIFSKITFMVLSILNIANTILGNVALDNTTIFGVVVYCLIMIWYIAILLSVNIKIFKSALRAFLFWFKVLSAIKANILEFALIYGYQIYGDDVGYSPLQIVYDIIGLINWTLLIMIFCVIDGIYIKRKWKILWSCLVSLYITYLAIYRTLKAPVIDTSVIEIASNLSFSLYHSYVSDLRVLALFLWKQTVLLILKPGKSINIKRSPFIKWE